MIHFTVNSVAYDPEIYTIMLGTSENILTNVDNAVNQTDPTGLTFLTNTELMYTITVDGLSINQMYYYLIVSTNSHSSVSSTIGTFTTAEAREIYMYFHCLHDVYM